VDTTAVVVLLIITPLTKHVVLDVLYNPVLIIENTAGMMDCRVADG
jgi:hypothetical protein